MLKTVSSITNAIGALNFKGTWNASTNTPTIVSGVGVKGDYFVVAVAGSTTIDGISNWGIGDWITYNGNVWQRVEGGADLNGVNLSVSGTTTLSNLTASTALALDAGKNVVSVTNTGTGNNVLATSPTLVTPILGTPQSGTVTNLTGTASININGTVGATTPATGSFTTLNTSGQVVFNDAGADVDFRVESDTKVNALFVEGSDGFVGVDNGAPIRPLVVRTQAGGDPTYGGDIVINSSAGATSVNATGGLEIKTNNGGSGFGTRLFDYFNGVSDFIFALQRRSNSATFTTRLQVFPGGQVTPGADGTQDLGTASLRWDDVFAVNGTIQTSDANEKQDIADLDDAERRVAVRAKSLLKKFRWKSSVAEKGDDARIHFGIIAQELQAAFEAEGLDAGRYGVFTLDEWWEADRVIPATDTNPEHTVTDTFQTENEAPEGAIKKSRMGVRYSELLAFIIASI